jgi:hypothetical protein
MTNDTDMTPEHRLTTEQIATGTARPPQDTPAPADEAGYEDGVGYEDNSQPAYDSQPGYVNDGQPAYDSQPGYVDDSQTRYEDETAAPLGTGTATSEPADRVAPGAPSNGGSATAPGAHASLLDESELQSLTMRWKDIQAEFVDEPTNAVQEADALVAELMQRLATMFANERAELEGRWSGGDEVSTEDLRQGLRLYRSFFERLLAA